MRPSATISPREKPAKTAKPADVMRRTRELEEIGRQTHEPLSLSRPERVGNGRLGALAEQADKNCAYGDQCRKDCDATAPERAKKRRAHHPGKTYGDE